jgi:hypothetical protein
MLKNIRDRGVTDVRGVRGVLWAEIAAIASAPNNVLLVVTPFLELANLAIAPPGAFAASSAVMMLETRELLLAENPPLIAVISAVDKSVKNDVSCLDCIVVPHYYLIVRDCKIITSVILTILNIYCQPQNVI